MSEDETVSPGDPAHPETLSYDFAKYLGTLAILLLGGVLSLTQADGEAPIDRRELIAIIAALSFGGVLALTTADAIVDSRLLRRERTKRVRIRLKVALGSLGLGVGGFLSTWTDRL